MSLFETALVQSLLDALWQDAALAAIAAATLAAMSRRTPAARHAVGLAFLLAMLLLPAAQLAQQLGNGLIAEPRAPTRTLASAVVHWPGIAWLGTASDTGMTAPAWLARAWVLGVLLMLGRLGGAWWWVQALERRTPAQSLPPHWRRRVDALLCAMGIRRPVVVRVLVDVAQPFTARAWRPVVWLPIALLTRLPAPIVEALIAHELAHIQRLDWVWNGLQCLVESLLFFHPAVWWLSRRVRAEREHACDDIAAQICGDRLVVAEALTQLERLRDPLPLLAQAAAGGVLRQRVHHLLALPRPAAPGKGLAGGVATLLLALAGAASLWAGQVAVALPDQPAAAVAPDEPDFPTDPWWTRVGESIRLRSRVDGHLHDYHTWVDWRGERHETYRIDGVPKAVDDGVRLWVAQRHLRPTPPVPPVPPAPLAPPPPPELPEVALPPLPPLANMATPPPSPRR
ncbi:M56 family metallopeptidase [Roseateles cellulosilyticus]|uniref:M56 family metallopeptidase n=1 Tax=Pelomonas cellulosilytica TaxID=2906762 RepID=A0ABS8XP51_9BURK|nr:M56 family metallopeptidase [Pelomonas sp. P8]MCE4553613.1 M56 family metallopeptidase [Pelomonas sp. P8]